MTEQEHIGSVAMGDTEAALEKALDAYWNVAYQQGQETRGHDDEHGTAQKAEDALRAAIAALSARPVQEPVAWLVKHKQSHSSGSIFYAEPLFDENWDRGDYIVTPLYAAPQPAHGTSATERDTPAPADHVVVTDKMLNNMLLARAPDRRWTLATLLKECDVGYADRLAYMRAALHAALNTPAPAENAPVDQNCGCDGAWDPDGCEKCSTPTAPTPKEESK